MPDIGSPSRDFGMKRRLRRAAVPLLVGLIAGFLLAVGLLTPRPSPLTPARQKATVRLESVARHFPVMVRVKPPVIEDVVSASEGIVTSSACTPGALASEGGSLLSVDGQRVVGLALAAAPYRDIEPGVVGDDVQALREALTRLGVLAPGPIAGFSIDEVGIIRSWLGLPAGGVVPARSLVRLPIGSPVPLRSCPVRLGQHISVGDSVAAVEVRPAAISFVDVAVDEAATIESVRIESTATDLAWPSGQQEASGPVVDRIVREFDAASAQTGDGPTADTSSDHAAVAASPEVETLVLPVRFVGARGSASCIVLAGSGKVRDVSVENVEFGTAALTASKGLAAGDVVLEPRGEHGCA